MNLTFTTVFPKENKSKHLDVFEAHLDCCSWGCALRTFFHVYWSLACASPPFYKWLLWQCWNEITKGCHLHKHLSFAPGVWTNIFVVLCFEFQLTSPLWKITDTQDAPIQQLTTLNPSLWKIQKLAPKRISVRVANDFLVLVLAADSSQEWLKQKTYPLFI